MNGSLTCWIGEGKHDAHANVNSDAESSSNASHAPLRSFAPQGTAALRKRLKDKIPANLQLQVPSTTSVGRIHEAWSVSQLNMAITKFPNKFADAD
jgi:hypothetical protein